MNEPNQAWLFVEVGSLGRLAGYRLALAGLQTCRLGGTTMER